MSAENDRLISLQAAIDALNEYFARIGRLKRRGLTKGEKAISLDTVGVIKTLPSTQPDIIWCKECKFYDGRPCGIVDWYNTPDDFCSKAERREDG